MALQKRTSFIGRLHLVKAEATPELVWRGAGGISLLLSPIFGVLVVAASVVAVVSWAGAKAGFWLSPFPFPLPSTFNSIPKW
jgi:hypothetical protein